MVPPFVSYGRGQRYRDRGTRAAETLQLVVGVPGDAGAIYVRK